MMTTPPASTFLAIGAGDRDRFQLVVEKAAELGVTRIIPIETERSKQVATRLRTSAIEKFQRHAAEACKQSGNPWTPLVELPVTLGAFLDAPPYARWFLAHPEGGKMPALEHTAAVGWLVGPEGGFTSEELLLISDRLAPSLVALGDHVLRFETAAIGAAALTWIQRRDG
jgi:16S rRNA (uracil1498-N3)-methyltransferase